MLLEKFTVSQDLTTARIDSMLSARGVNGLIIAPLTPEMKTFEMNWRNYSLIAIGPTLRKPALHQVMANYFENMRLLLKACAEWGYKRPGLCLDTSSDERIGGQWEACYLREQINHPQLEPVALFQYTDLNPQELHAWIKKSRPDIILCLSTQGVLDSLKQIGLQVPNDIGVASVCAARPSGWLSGIVEDGYHTGVQAVSQLLRMIFSNETGIPECPIKILLPSRINRGASTF